MIPRFKPRLGWSEFFSLWGPVSKREIGYFEAAFAQMANQRYALAFPYGRTGLALLLEAMGLRQKEIICPAYTCVVVPHAIITSNNEPVFIDSQDRDFNMDLDLASSAITEKTGVIIATSIFGYPVDLDHLCVIKNQYPHIHIIQDCAHSFFAEWEGQSVCKVGDAAIYGLNISKLMTSIFGGMVTTDREDLYHELKRLRRERIQKPNWKKQWMRRMYLAAVYIAFFEPIYGMTNALEQKGILNRLAKYYEEGTIDMPPDYLEEMTAIEAHIGKIQLNRYGEIIKHRRRLAQYYDENLQGIPALSLPPLVEGATYSHYVPRTERREKIVNDALRKGIQLGEIIDYCIPEMSAYQNRTGNRFSYTVASKMAKSVINLPLSIKMKQGEKIVSVLKQSCF